MAPTERELQNLVNQLKDYRSRAAARQQLRRAGNAAVACLLPALSDNDAPTNMRWAVITLLGDCRSSEAIEPLIEIVRTDLGLRGEAVRALQLITGADYGEDIEQWQAFRRGEISATDDNDTMLMGPTQNLDFAALQATIEQALAPLAQQLSWEDPGYAHLVMPISGGRKHQLLISFEQNDASNQAMACFYTECGVAAANTQAMLSQRSGDLDYGQFGIESDDTGCRKIIMRHTLAITDFTADNIREIATAMTRDADSLEAELHQTDQI